MCLADVEKTWLKLPEVSSPDLRRHTWRTALQIAATPGSLPYKYRGRQKFASEESALQTQAAEIVGKHQSVELRVLLPALNGLDGEISTAGKLNFNSLYRC